MTDPNTITSAEARNALQRYANHLRRDMQTLHPLDRYKRHQYADKIRTLDAIATLIEQHIRRDAEIIQVIEEAAHEHKTSYVGVSSIGRSALMRIHELVDNDAGTATTTNATQIAIVEPNDMPLSPREQKALELAREISCGKHIRNAAGYLLDCKTWQPKSPAYCENCTIRHAIIELLGGEQG